MKLLWLDPNRAFKLTKPKTVDNLVKVVHPEYKGFFESFSIFSYKGACACWKLSCPKIENHVFYIMSHVYINRLSVRDYGDVWQFPMPYPFFVIQNDPVTYKMWSYVIYWLASPICTINTWTGKFSTQRWCIMFSKFQEFFNTILILFSNTWCFHPTSIHVSPLLLHFIKLSHMHENLTFFIKGVTLSHSRRNFGNISHWSPSTQHESGDMNSTTIKYASREQSEVHYKLCFSIKRLRIHDGECEYKRHSNNKLSKG